MNCACTPANARNAGVDTREASPEPSMKPPATEFLAPVDMYETEDQIVIVADVPGAKAEDVEVRAEDGVLSLTAQVKARVQAGSRRVMNEYRVGGYARSFKLGTGLDASKISAELSAGVLTIRVPKSQDLQPKKIPIATK
jgi:HSP20 family protein